MGKKAKFKKFRKIAELMPVINIGAPRKEILTGKEVLSQGVKEVQGEAVDSEKNYIRKFKVPAPLNHNRKMKDLYNKHGFKGVERYVNAINHIRRDKAGA